MTRNKVFKHILLLNSLILLSFIGIYGCCDIICSKEEIYRETSEENVVDAVVIEINCGATTSFAYDVYIVPKGSRIKDQHLIFSANNVRDLEVKWIRPRLLTIGYTKAKIFKFRNYWQSRDLDYYEYGYEVTIREYMKRKPTKSAE